MSDELTDRLIELFADMLMHRAGAKVDDVAELQRLNAQLMKERVARPVDLLTMAEAAERIGREQKSLRPFLKRNKVGQFEHGRWIVSRRQLCEFLERKGKLPAGLRAEANKAVEPSNASVASGSEKNLASTKST